MSLRVLALVFVAGSASAQEAPDPASDPDASSTDAEAPPLTDEETEETEDSDAGDSSRAVRLSDRAELDRVVALYMAGSYAKCSAQLGGFLDPTAPDPFTDASVIEQGRLYFASCALLEGRRDEARKALRDALEQNPLMHSPDSLTFPPPVVSLFLEVRDEVQQLIAESEKEQVVRLRRENELARRKAEQREYRERELEKLAREERLIEKNSRFIASIPFGVGQYQNGNEPLGALFLVTEGLLLGTAITSGLVLDGLTSSTTRSERELTKAGVTQYNNQTAAAHDVLTWSSWGLVGVAAIGILEAQLSFKRERVLEKRRRELPPELQVPVEPSEPSSLSVRPTFGFGPGGGQLGLSGSF